MPGSVLYLTNVSRGCLAKRKVKKNDQVPLDIIAFVLYIVSLCSILAKDKDINPTIIIFVTEACVFREQPGEVPTT